MTILDTDCIGKSFETIFNTFTYGNSDHLLSVKVKILLNFEGNDV